MADKPPPSRVFSEVALPAAEESGEYCRVFCDQEGSGSLSSFGRGGGISCPDTICGSGFAVIDIAARPEI